MVTVIKIIAAYVAVHEQDLYHLINKLWLIMTIEISVLNYSYLDDNTRWLTLIVKFKPFFLKNIVKKKIFGNV